MLLYKRAEDPDKIVQLRNGCQQRSLYSLVIKIRPVYDIYGGKYLYLRIQTL